MSLNEISYLDAWHRWFIGESVSTYYLWGRQILWWGRIGKLVSFLSALAVIAELIGPERLRSYGESLHGRFTIDKAKRLIKSGFHPVSLVFFAFKADFPQPSRRRAKVKGEEKESDKLMREFFQTKIGCASVIIGLIGSVYLAYLVSKVYSFWIAALAFLFMFGFGYALILPFAAALIVTLAMVLLLLIDGLFIEPTAWLLELKSFDKTIKAGSLMLLVIGFHFDLLAS